MQNMVAAVKEANKLLSNGTTVTAQGCGHHPMTSFRVMKLRREDGDYYAKALDDGLWYPIRKLYGPDGREL